MNYCNEHGISHNFSTPRTPQQNGVVERKNRTSEEMARTMLIASGLPRNFWAEAVNTACYILNRVLIRPITSKTPYELFKGVKPNISNFCMFGCRCFFHFNGKRNLGKFDERSDEGVVLGYSSHSKAYRVYNNRTMCVEEFVLIFDEINFMTNEQDTDNFKIGLANKEDDEDITKEQDQRAIWEQLIQEQIEVPNQAEQPVNEDLQGVPNPVVPRNEQDDQVEVEQNINQVSDLISTTVLTREFVPKPWEHQKFHPFDLIISNLNKGTQTRFQMRNLCAHFAFLTTLEPENQEEALKDSEWVVSYKMNWMNLKDIMYDT